MARAFRASRADSWHLVTSRGNGPDELFRTDADRRRFLGLVSEIPRRFGIGVHAFVLLPGHYRLLLHVRDANLSEAMKWLKMLKEHGNWVRDAVLAVATRELGWRLTELAAEIPGLGYAAAGKRVQRFVRMARPGSKAARFAVAIARGLSNV
jgi:REP element-mobilizing transposase RayT